MTVDTEWIVDFFRRQARLGFEEGDYTRTRNSCRELLQYVPDDVEAWGLLGEAALASRDSVAALRAFDQLVELQPENPSYAMQLGQACLQAQDWPAAASAFRQVLDVDPQHTGALEALALIEQLQARLNVLDASAAQPSRRNDPCPCGSGVKYKKCCLEKSSQQMIRQRLDQAFAGEQWQQVVDLAAELPQPSTEVQRAVALSRYQLCQRAPAYPLINAAYQLYPDDLDLRAALADLELDHDVSLAEQLATAVLQLDQSQWRASLVLAACHSRFGRPLESERVLRELLEHNPECDLAWQRLSYFLRKNGRLDDDFEAMREWTERCPNKSEAWVHCGMSAVMNNDMESGRQYLQHVLDLAPQNHEALCWMGQSYQMEQNPHRALEFLMRPSM
jgi:cytochrome c-type biogenesis protein CcmH/NrfG